MNGNGEHQGGEGADVGRALTEPTMLGRRQPGQSLGDIMLPQSRSVKDGADRRHWAEEAGEQEEGIFGE